MLFLGLGTGLGNAIVENWHVEPLELAHLPYRKGLSYEEYIGDAGLQRLGDERWEAHVHKICDLFRAALLCDGIVLGGGNARKLVNLPDFATRGSNENAIVGGIRLWDRGAETTPPEFSDTKTAQAIAAPDAPVAPVVAKRRLQKKSAAKQVKKATSKAVTRTAKSAKKAPATKVPRKPVKSPAKSSRTKTTTARRSSSRRTS